MARKQGPAKTAAASEMARLRYKKMTPEERQELASRAGKASAAKLTPAQRKTRSQKAINARWGKRKP